MTRNKTYIFYLLLFLTAVLAMLPLAQFIHPLKYDFIDQAYPWKYFIGECLQEGILPLWNPYQLLGSPIHADPQSSAWYPVTWFFGYLFGYSIYTISIDFLLHIFLAGMGMFYMARILKFREETAFIMGVSYMLSGFFIGNAQHFMWIISGTWIPFIIGAFLQLRNDPSFRSAIRLGLAFFMIMTGGYPAFIVLLLYFLAAVFILFAVEYFRKKEYHELFTYSKYLIFSGIYTILIGMVVLISVYFLQDTITRGDGVTLRQALFGAFTPQSFISFILPFASIRDMEFYGTDLSMSNAYIGILTLVFFLAGLSIKRTKLVNVFLAWGIFCLAASVGSALPLREFLYDYVPFMNMFRFPALFRVFFILSFIVVAGYAFDEWMKNPGFIALKLRISIFLVIALVIGFMIYSIFQGELHMIDFIKNQLLYFSESSTIAQHVIFQGTIQLILLTLILLLITKWRLKKYALAGLLLITGADMMLATRWNSPYTVYSHIFKSHDIYEHAKQFPDGFPLPGDGPILDNTDMRGLVFQTLWRNLNIFHKQISFEGYNPLHLKGFEEMADNHVKLFETILQNPLVYLSGNISPMDSVAIHEQNNDFQKTRIYLEADDYLELKIEDIKLKVEDSVIVKSFSPVEVTVVSRTKDHTLVNLLQNNYYGWKVEIDGKPARVYTANMSFVSGLVPAGEHEVVFRYDPKGVWFGFWISLCALVLGVFFLALKIVPAKKQE